MSVLDLLFPKACLECHREGNYICAKCLAKVDLAAPICPRCQRPSIDGMTHFACKRRLGIGGLTSIWEYDGVIRRTILALKYKFASDVARELVVQALGQLKIRKLPFPKEATLVPVPLHRLRYNWRGFNQSEEMGKLLAKGLGLGFVPNLLIRKRQTIPQTELGEKERAANVRGIFSLDFQHKATMKQFNNSTILLFDDVFTTGSTLKEAAKTLKRGGAKRVWGLTIAR